jgi:hypothetical protein
MWNSIHYIALGYPNNPTLNDQNNYKTFFLSLGPVLPCHKCSINYQKHLIELPIDMYLINNEKLFEWTVKLHNIVNKENNKPEWTLKQAKDFYSNIIIPPKNNDINIYWLLFYIILVILIIISVYYFKHLKK